MRNIAQAAVAARTGVEAVFFPFKQKSLEMGSAKKGFKGGACDFFEAWGRVEGEGWFLSCTDWKQQLMIYCWGDPHSPPVPVMVKEGSPQKSFCLRWGTPSWDCREEEPGELSN